MESGLIFIYLFCGLVAFLLGIIVLLSNKKAVTNKVFFIFSISQALWCFSITLLYSDATSNLANYWAKGSYGFSVIMGMAGLLFFYYFPKTIIKVPGWIRISYLFTSFFVFFITTFTPLIHNEIILSDGKYTSDKLGPLYIIYAVYLALHILLPAYLVYKKIKLFQGIERRKILIAAVGFIVFGLFALLINVLLPIFNLFIYQDYTVLLSLIFILSIFYSFYKNRFFNLSHSVLNLSRSIVLFLIYFLFIITSNIIFSFFFHSIKIYDAFLFSSLLSLILIIQINKVLPVFIPSSFLKFRNSLVEFKSKIYFCSSLIKLNKEIENTFILNCGIQDPVLYVVREKKTQFPVPVYTNNSLTQEIIKIHPDILIYDEINYKNYSRNIQNIFRNKMEKIGAAAIVPLFSENVLIGMLVLGRKENKSILAKEEIQEILNIKHQLEITLMNLLIKLNLEEENNLVKKMIDDKTAELKKQFLEIKELLKQQSDFLAITAHEFRTPLSIALFQLEDTLISHKHTPEVLQDIKTTEEALMNLKQLTQKLFDVQQYDLNKVELHKEKTDIAQYIQKIYDEFMPMMKEKKIKFSYINKLKNPLFINIDQGHIRQVLLNLLNNSVKFINSAEPQIKLIVSQKGTRSEITVEDNGPGIPDSHKNSIFEKFRTVKATKGMGIGLGLYLCRKILELHKSKIWVEDAPKGGAVFSFLLGE